MSEELIQDGTKQEHATVTAEVVIGEFDSDIESINQHTTEQAFAGAHVDVEHAIDDHLLTAFGLAVDAGCKVKGTQHLAEQFRVAKRAVIRRQLRDQRPVGLVAIGRLNASGRPRHVARGTNEAVVAVGDITDTQFCGGIAIGAVAFDRQHVNVAAQIEQVTAGQGQVPIDVGVT